MYYKIKNDILFRQYKGYGYITDNSEFGYEKLGTYKASPGEKYISESGSVMLATLGKTPRHIDDIMVELTRIFRNVDFDILKRDTMDFFHAFACSGYLNQGETYEKCQDMTTPPSPCGDDAEKILVDEGNQKYSLNPNDLLRSIHIEIIKGCNERCVHCFIPHNLANEMMDPSLFFRILKEGRDLNIINVTLSGGEPLLHKNFIYFLKKCREKDLSVNVLSNLTLLTDEIMEEMIKNPLLCVQTSLYSMNSDIHDAITNHNGSSEKTKKGLLKLHSAGIPVQISCPVMKKNKDSFIDVLQFGRELGMLVAIEPMIFPAYDRSRSNLENRLSLKELKDAVNTRLLAGQAIPIRENARDKEEVGEDDPICTICRYKLCISPNGDVFPCVGWPTNIIGSLNQKTLRDIWENSEKIQALRQIKRKQFPKCVACEDRGYCTVCMMNNSNGSPDGNIFHIDDFNCKAAALIHKNVDAFFLANKEGTA